MLTYRTILFCYRDFLRILNFTVSSEYNGLHFCGEKLDDKTKTSVKLQKITYMVKSCLSLNRYKICAVNISSSNINRNMIKPPF